MDAHFPMACIIKTPSQAHTHAFEEWRSEADGCEHCLELVMRSVAELVSFGEDLRDGLFRPKFILEEMKVHLFFVCLLYTIIYNH